MSTARLDAFARGKIIGLAEGGLTHDEILTRVTKTDGSPPTLRSVEATLARARDVPEWRGKDSTAGGRPRELSDAEQKQLVDLVFAERGRAKAWASETTHTPGRAEWVGPGRAGRGPGPEYTSRSGPKECTPAGAQAHGTRARPGEIHQPGAPAEPGPGPGPARPRVCLLPLALKVTTSYCKRLLPFLRRLSKQGVCNALHRAGLAYLRRRRKSIVPPEWRARRKVYCRWLKRQPQGKLNRYAYTDGTTFYLARGAAEDEDKRRAALGPSVWRMSSGKDGLWDENIGPSLYAKAQGLPVKIWGFFADGRLEYYLLPPDPNNGKKTTNMTGALYNTVIKTRFAKWRKACFPRGHRVHLVQDYERCLWRPDNLDALREAGCDVVKQHTKYSPDLNAIEMQWSHLRERLESTAPAHLEARAEFIKRLRRTVTWMNWHQRVSGRRLCRGQKQRADEVLELDGAKCSW